MKRSLLLTFLAPVFLAGSLHAASDYLLEIDGIKGESTDSAHGETIEIDSFSWGASNDSSGGGAGKVYFSDLSVVTKISRATPKLLLACATGQRIPNAKLYVRKPGSDNEDYYIITMSDILVSSVQQSGSPPPLEGGDSRPVEKFALYFNAVTISHTGDDGTKTTGEATRTETR